MSILAMNVRRTIKAVANPLDKSTVVSIFPRFIESRKLTVSPGKFRLEAGSYEKPSILVVGPSSWWKETGEDEPLLEIVVGSVQMADSIVKDWANGLHGCNMADTMPGVFWLPGELTVEQIIKNHKPALDLAKLKQENFWRSLVRSADGFWARTNGSPLAISEEARMAAAALNLKDKEWMKDFSSLQMVSCKACGQMVRPGYPVCSNCKAIVDPVRAKELGLQFAS